MLNQVTVPQINSVNVQACVSIWVEKVALIMNLIFDSSFPFLIIVSNIY